MSFTSHVCFPQALWVSVMSRLGWAAMCCSPPAAVRVAASAMQPRCQLQLLCTELDETPLGGEAAAGGAGPRPPPGGVHLTLCGGGRPSSWRGGTPGGCSGLCGTRGDARSVPAPPPGPFPSCRSPTSPPGARGARARPSAAAGAGRAAPLALQPVTRCTAGARGGQRAPRGSAKPRRAWAAPPRVLPRPTRAERLKKRGNSFA